MPILNVYSKRYKKELTNYYVENLKNKHTKELIKHNNNDVAEIVINSNYLDLHSFSDFIKNLIIYNNSAVNGSMELCNIIKNKITGYDNYIMNQVQNYFEECSIMNLEGFIYFRTNEYSYAVSMFLYSVVKNEYIRNRT